MKNQVDQLKRPPDQLDSAEGNDERTTHSIYRVLREMNESE
jgi:hypothetical protein